MKKTIAKNILRHATRDRLSWHSMWLMPTFGNLPTDNDKVFHATGHVLASYEMSVYLTLQKLQN